ncbi:MAG: hypothetical protein ACRD1H_20120, partial [Vicinamibacterales bacterium]
DYRTLTAAGRRRRLAYLFDRSLEVASGPARELAHGLQRLHTGIINDYLLWNVAGTILLMVGLAVLAIGSNFVGDVGP